MNLCKSCSKSESQHCLKTISNSSLSLKATFNCHLECIKLTLVGDFTLYHDTINANASKFSCFLHYRSLNIVMLSKQYRKHRYYNVQRERQATLENLYSIIPFLNIIILYIIIYIISGIIAAERSLPGNPYDRQKQILAPAKIFSSFSVQFTIDYTRTTNRVIPFTYAISLNNVLLN